MPCRAATLRMLPFPRERDESHGRDQLRATRRSRGERHPRLSRHSVRGWRVGPGTLEGPAAAPAMGGRARCDELRNRGAAELQHARADARAGLQQHRRRLSRLERLDTGLRRGAAAGDGMDSWRCLHDRLRGADDVQRRDVGAPWRPGRSHHQLSPRQLRLPSSQRDHRRPYPCYRK